MVGASEKTENIFQRRTDVEPKFLNVGRSFFNVHVNYLNYNNLNDFVAIACSSLFRNQISKALDTTKEKQLDESPRKSYAFAT